MPRWLSQLTSASWPAHISSPSTSCWSYPQFSFSCQQVGDAMWGLGDICVDILADAEPAFVSMTKRSCRTYSGCLYCPSHHFLSPSAAGSDTRGCQRTETARLHRWPDQGLLCSATTTTTTAVQTASPAAAIPAATAIPTATTAEVQGASAASPPVPDFPGLRLLNQSGIEKRQLFLVRAEEQRGEGVPALPLFWAQSTITSRLHHCYNHPAPPQRNAVFKFIQYKISAKNKEPRDTSHHSFAKL